MAAGAVIGLLLGLLGAGGSIIAVPVLTLAAGLPVREAIATALVVVLCSSLSAVIPRLRSGVRWSTAAIMIAAGAPCTAAGATLGRGFDEQALAFGFVGVAALAVFFLLRAPNGTATRADAGGLGRLARTILAGAIVGTLTGLLGVGGGFLIVPALTLLLGLPMTVAIGTSLVVIGANALTGLVAQLSTVSLDWMLTGAFAATTMATAAIASRSGMDVPERALRRAFGSLVLAVSTLMLLAAFR
nr:sulfite exporter TauE/SafE family protein [Rhodococcus sp. HNM0569]